MSRMSQQEKAQQALDLRRAGAQAVLAELERWAAGNHHHHVAHDDEGCLVSAECRDADEPYVNSEDLVREIRRLREQAW